MGVSLTQSRAKLIRLLHQHVRWKRDRRRGLGGYTVMRSWPLCSAPFYIFRFPENVCVCVCVRMFAMCRFITIRSAPALDHVAVIQVACYMLGIFKRPCLDSGQCHDCYHGIQEAAYSLVLNRLQHLDLFWPNQKRSSLKITSWSHSF